MKLKKIDPQTAERKPCYVQDYTHEHGRSRVIVECPFCGRANIAYIWSLAGSGKRCGNDDCRAHLCYGVAIRDMVPDERVQSGRNISGRIRDVPVAHRAAPSKGTPLGILKGIAV